MYAGLVMRVPADERRQGIGMRGMVRRGVVWAAVCGIVLLGAGTSRAASAGSKAEKQGVAWMQLPLEDLGFPGMSTPFLESGASMLTVHFVDSSHLLLTYSERMLVPRIADDPDAGVDDRIVAAKLIDLPSGRVIATTQWHMHDHGRYLWKLGNGSFLVRIANKLYTISPLAELAAKLDPFQRTVFPSRGLQPSAVVVSPDGGLVTVETVVKTANSTGQTVVVLGDTDSPASEFQGSKTLIDFFRVRRDAGGLEVAVAGSITAPVPLFLPLDPDGLLWAQQVASDQWAMTFDGFGGRTLQLGTVQSTCQPRLQMLGASEFVALSCRGGDDRIRMASFGLDGKETWEEQVGDFGVPSFAFAPAAARFAVSHIQAAEVPVTAGQVGIPARQEMRIYQNASGDLLLKVECTPVIKAAENFDLSGDGLEAVAVRNGNLALYKLPALSDRDREDIAEVGKFAPPAVTEGNVRLPRLTGAAGAAAKASVAAAAAVPVSVASAPVAATSTPMGAPLTPTVQTPEHRKPPTFLEPGEKPEFGTPNEPLPSQTSGPPPPG